MFQIVAKAIKKFKLLELKKDHVCEIKGKHNTHLRTSYINDA